MKKKHLLFTTLMLGVLATLTLGVAFTVSRTKSQPPAPAAPQSVVAQASAPASKGGPQETIKVHGHWLIEVRNRDGNLVTRREFDNALTPNGASTLTVLLARAYYVGTWSIGVGGLCIQEQGNDFPNCVPHKTLVVTTAAGPSRLILKGNFTADKDSVISNVSTLTRLCPWSFTPEQCAAMPASDAIKLTGDFTSHDLISGSDTPPVNVLNEQIVQVTVTISFPVPGSPS